MLEYAHKCGLFLQGANGLVPITWSEINHWSQLTKTPLHEHEAQAMMEMSTTYINWSNLGKDEGCEAPYQTGEEKANYLAWIEQQKQATEMEKLLAQQQQNQHVEGY